MSVLDDVAEVLQRHRAFWRRERVDRPLTSVRRYSPLVPRRLPLADSTLAGENVHLTPEMLDPRVLARFERGSAPGQILVGDVLSVRLAYRRIPWIEAVLGCPIVAEGNSGAVWSEPFLRDVRDSSSLASRPDDSWYRKLLECTRVLVEDNDGSYLVSDPQLRGPMDLARAVLGDEPMCLATYDAPESLRSLLDVTSDVFIQVVKGLQGVIPPFHGGYCTSFGIWAPGTVARSQCDVSALLSPRTHADLVLPFEEKIFRQFDYSVIHLHSGYLHTLDALLAAELPHAIEISLDAVVDLVDAREIVPVCKRILERKPLLLEGRMTIADFEYLVATLPPHGLYVRADLDPEEFMRWSQ